MCLNATAHITVAMTDSPDGMAAAARVCNRCHQTRPHSAFHRDKALPGGRRYTCKGCAAEAARRSELTRYRATNGLSSTYRSMMKRCFNPRHKSYPRYGGRGITVCPEWCLSFDVFYSWACSAGHQAGLQLDRLDNDGHYQPGNCRWVSPSTNMQNSSNARLRSAEIAAIRALLRAGKTHRDIAHSFGVSPSVISNIHTGKAWRNKYDAWNRLVQFDGGTDASRYDYPFDALHRRVREDVREYVEYDENIADYIDYWGRVDLFYSDSRQVIESHLFEAEFISFDGYNLRDNRTYVYSAGYQDELIGMDRGVQFISTNSSEDYGYSTRQYYQQDANFNVTSVTDETGGVQLRYIYDPYGASTQLEADFSVASTQDPSASPRFQGKRWNEVMGLYQFDAREYNPSLGRFMQNDPIRQGDGPNMYQFVGGNPVNWVDPSGLAKGSGLDQEIDAQLNDRRTLPQQANSRIDDIASAAGTGIRIGIGALKGALQGIINNVVDTVNDMAPVGASVAISNGGMAPFPGDATTNRVDPELEAVLRKIISGEVRLVEDQNGLIATIPEDVERQRRIAKAVSDAALALAGLLKGLSGLRGGGSRVPANTSTPVSTTPLPARPDIAGTLRPNSAMQGISNAVREIDKHSGRAGTSFPKLTGNQAQKNEQAAAIVQDIIDNGVVTTRDHGVFGPVTEIRVPGGRGLRFGPNGELIGCLEPPRGY